MFRYGDLVTQPRRHINNSLRIICWVECWTPDWTPADRGGITIATVILAELSHQSANKNTNVMREQSTPCHPSLLKLFPYNYNHWPSLPFMVFPDKADYDQCNYWFLADSIFCRRRSEGEYCAKINIEQLTALKITIILCSTRIWEFWTSRQVCIA